MHILRVASSFALATALCNAQSVATTVGGSTLTAGAIGPGGIPDFATQAAGPLPLPGSFSHVAFGGVATIQWDTLGSATSGGTTSLRHELNSFASPAEFSAMGTLTLEFTSTAPVIAGLFVLGSSSGSSGAPIPTIDVDFGADGTFELQSALGPVLDFGTHAISPTQPLLVAIRMQTTLPANLASIVSLAEVTLTPSNDLDWQQTALDCATTPTFLRCRPSFADRGIDVTWLQAVAPLVVVIGLAAEPVILPSVGSVPCLLVPRPDILLFAPLPIGWASHHVPLSPAVRPVTFFVQGVVLDPAGLQTTDGFVVDAF